MEGDCVYTEQILRLQKAVQLKTVSETRNGELHFPVPESLPKFHEFLRNSFPETFAASAGVELVNDGSFLLHFIPSEESATPQSPFLLVAHMDVVPTNDEEWSVPPFDGVIKVS